MKCDEVLTYLDPLLDDELPADTTALAMEHLISCIKCGEEWNAMLSLRKQFQDLSDGTAVPPHALKAIDKRLETCIPPPITVGRLTAAAAVALGVFACFVLLQAKPPLSASCEQVLLTYNDNPGPATLNPSDRQVEELSHHVRFSPATFKLSGWTLRSADVLHLPRHICLLRLIYETGSGGQIKRIVCYESCQGELNTSGLNRRIVNGRLISYGTTKGLSLVHWSSDGRDHLLVSSIPEQELMLLASYV